MGQLVQRTELFRYGFGEHSAVCTAIYSHIDVIGDGSADDIAIILLLLQTGNADTHQHCVNLGITDGPGPGSDLRQRHANAGLILHGWEPGDRRLRLRARTKVPGDILEVHRAVGVAQRRAVKEDPGSIQSTSKLAFTERQQHTAARHRLRGIGLFNRRVLLLTAAFCTSNRCHIASINKAPDWVLIEE